MGGGGAGLGAGSGAGAGWGAGAGSGAGLGAGVTAFSTRTGVDATTAGRWQAVRLAKNKTVKIKVISFINDPLSLTAKPRAYLQIAHQLGILAFS